MPIRTNAVRSVLTGILACAACVSVVGVGGVLGGCGTTHTFAYELDHPLLAQGVALDVRNFRGSVDVRVNPNIEHIRVKSYVNVSPYIEDEHVPEAMQAVEVHAEVVEQDDHAVLQVRSTTLRPLAEDHAVDLFITMPRCDGVYVENAYGLVELVNIRGAVQVSNHKGAIEVRTKHVMTDPVTLTAVDGSIWYQIPIGSAGHVDLESMDGEVRFADRMQGTNQVHNVSYSTFDATLNGGTNPIIARTNKGNIAVLVLDDPVALTRAIHSPAPDWNKMIFQKGSNRHLRGLPEDHPEVRSDTRSDRAVGEGRRPPVTPED